MKKENTRNRQLRDAMLKTPGGLFLRRMKEMPLKIGAMKANQKRKMMA